MRKAKTKQPVVKRSVDIPDEPNNSIFAILALMQELGMNPGKTFVEKSYGYYGDCDIELVEYE
jgi:hypothetical protein